MNPAPQMYYCYILKSLKDERLYIGSTQNLRKRFSEHNDGKVFSTKSRRPFRLLYYEAYRYEKLARLRESKLKSFGKAYQELKKRIVGGAG